ncbi:MAG TPA: cyclic nucleotide-binding domain-containing protein [Gemmatimonadaceae bacterium]|nr:cyclic nucleotide-binding domain-containing protein [Gemmatimonadaceae bacterium]
MPSSVSSASLKRLAFFAGLPETLLWHLARAAESRTLELDALLFSPGEDRQVLAIVLSGEISIEQVRDGVTVQITKLGAGEVVGEGILLDDSKHGTTGRAAEKTDLLCLRREPLLKLLKDQPALYAALLGRTAKIISERIKRANATLLGVTSEFAGVRAHADQWISNVMALTPEIGCEKAMQVARDAMNEGRNPRDLARERKLVN